MNCKIYNNFGVTHLCFAVRMLQIGTRLLYVMESECRAWFEIGGSESILSIGLDITSCNLNIK